MSCKVISTAEGAMILCGTSSKPKHCSYCERPSERLCDAKLSDDKTCDAPMCKIHAFAVSPTEDHCRLHARKARPPVPRTEAEKRTTITFIARSKFDGRCKVRGCGNRWEAGDPIYYDHVIKEAYCEDCGNQLSPY